MNSPKIAFVIPTHNHCPIVLKTLSLLRASVGRLPHEILVVDHGSTDGTAEAVARRFPQVRLIELDTRQDAAARNVAIMAAEAEYVFLLDEVTWPDKATAELALRMMTEQPRLGAANCRVQRVGEPLRPEAGVPAGVISGSAVMLRRRAVIEVGGWPIDYEGCMAGYDLSARLWQAGWQVKRFEGMAAWRDSGAAQTVTLPKVVAASAVRFWSRYAPEERYEEILGEPVQQCRVRRRPLSEEQFASLIGAEQPAVRRAATAASVQTAA